MNEVKWAVMEGIGGYFRGEDKPITGVDGSELFETITRLKLNGQN